MEKGLSFVQFNQYNSVNAVTNGGVLAEGQVDHISVTKDVLTIWDGSKGFSGRFRVGSTKG